MIVFEFWRGGVMGELRGGQAISGQQAALSPRDKEIQLSTIAVERVGGEARGRRVSLWLHEGWGKFEEPDLCY